MKKRSFVPDKTMSIAQLEQLQRDIAVVIDQKRCTPTELDIAIEHIHHPDLLHETVRTESRERSSVRVELRRIYCSAERCPRCPHGPYFYSIRPNKRRGTETLRFTGEPVFSEEVLERIGSQIRPPIAIIELIPPSQADKKGRAGDKEGCITRRCT